MTLENLMSLCAMAHEKQPGCWFVNLSGHVNTIVIQYYPTGWTVDEPHYERLEETLTPDGIAGLYYFVRNRTNL